MKNLIRLTLVLLWINTAACWAETRATPAFEIEINADPSGKIISAEHFTAGASFFRPGLHDGTLPDGAPGSQRIAFAQALRASGVRTLRFPNGNESHYYLWDAAATALKLRKALVMKSGWSPGQSELQPYTSAREVMTFCRDHGFGLIYQLPTMFFWDREAGRARAFTKNDLAEKARAPLYDHDRIAEGVAYAEEIVRYVVREKIPVVRWELGNEEFAHMPPADFARIVAAYLVMLDKYSPDPSVAFALQGGTSGASQIVEYSTITGEKTTVTRSEHWVGWVKNLAAEFAKLGLTDRINRPSVGAAIHYPAAASYRPKNEAEMNDPALMASINLAPNRAKDTMGSQINAVGLGAMSLAVTETNGARNRWWNHLRLNPSHAYGLTLAAYWMALLEHPRISVISHHDVETPFFGLLRYNVEWQRDKAQFVYLTANHSSSAEEATIFRNQYVISPACRALGELSKLSGLRLDRVKTTTTNPEAQVLAKSDMLAVISASGPEARQTTVLVNRSPTPLKVVLTYPDARPRKLITLAAHSLGSVLPEEMLTATTNLAAAIQFSIDIPRYAIVSVSTK